MNCKQGDIAIVIGGALPNSPNLGKIVHCLEFVPKGTIVASGDEFIQTAVDSWKTDIPLQWCRTTAKVMLKEVFLAGDYALRPLRDTDGEDETLQRAGKPSKIEEVQYEREVQYEQKL